MFEIMDFLDKFIIKRYNSISTKDKKQKQYLLQIIKNHNNKYLNSKNEILK